jgi:hypothetical protein
MPHTVRRLLKASETTPLACVAGTNRRSFANVLDGQVTEGREDRLVATHGSPDRQLEESFPGFDDV